MSQLHREAVTRRLRVVLPFVMLNLLIMAQQAATPGDCVLTGLCGLITAKPPVAPGVMYVAVGLVGFGVWGLWRLRRAD